MTDKKDDDALFDILAALKGFEPEDRKRIIETVITYFNIPIGGKPQFSYVQESATPYLTNEKKHGVSFSEDRSITAKEFLRDKAPKTDVERITCLAYYLANYRDTPHFKTLDLSSLNTEAAQPKFSNAAKAVDNAARAGFLVQAQKGMKQISAVGESYVQNLPNREAARESIVNIRLNRRSKKNGAKTKAK